jgi:uncharacterized protein YjbI with pentapeptide repeats
LCQQDMANQETLQRKLVDLVQGGRKVSSPAIELRLRLLVVLAFINTYNASYRDIDGFSSDVQSLALDLKSRDSVAFDIWRACFRGINLNDIELKLDLDGYNFSRSTLSNVQILRQEVRETLFDDCHLQRVAFCNCDLKNMTLKGVDGDVAFDKG